MPHALLFCCCNEFIISHIMWGSITSAESERVKGPKIWVFYCDVRKLKKFCDFTSMSILQVITYQNQSSVPILTAKFGYREPHKISVTWSYSGWKLHSDSSYANPLARAAACDFKDRLSGNAYMVTILAETLFTIMYLLLALPFLN